MQYGKFTAREIIYYNPNDKWEDENQKQIKKYTSTELKALVNGKSPFSMDITCEIGMLRFFNAKSREDVQKMLKDTYEIEISTGSISNHSLEFLIRFELYHELHFDLIVDAIKRDGGYILGADGTGDGGSDRILLLMDLVKCWTLSASIIPSEKKEYISPAFEDIVKRAGMPLRYVRDMGPGLVKAGNSVLVDVDTLDCNFHFLRGVGRDIMTDDYQDFRRKMISLKVRSDLVKYRKTLNLCAKSANISLCNTIESLNAKIPATEIGMNNVSLTGIYHLSSWILNYTEDTKGARFPYGLPWVNLYRRCEKGLEAFDAMYPMLNQTSCYIKEAKVLEKIIKRPFNAKIAIDLLTIHDNISESYRLFSELRTILRIPNSKADVPRDQLFISNKEDMMIKEELLEFRNRLVLTKHLHMATDEELKVLKHLNKHWDGLTSPNVVVTVNGEQKIIPVPRAISHADSRFGKVKTEIRKRTGRKDTKHELNRYGPSLCLLQNLYSDEYVKVMFGSLENVSKLLGDIPKSLVEDRLNQFKTEQCRYDVTNAKGKNSFEKFMDIVQDINKELVSMGHIDNCESFLKCTA